MAGRRGKGWIGPNKVKYKTFKEMCDAYGVKESTVKSRLKHGKSLKEAIENVDGRKTRKRKTKKKVTNPFKHMKVSDKVKLMKSVTDHLGNRYESLDNMLSHYKITKRSYQARLKNNWTLEEILTTPMHKERVVNYTDVVDLGYRKHKS